MMGKSSLALTLYSTYCLYLYAPFQVNLDHFKENRDLKIRVKISSDGAIELCDHVFLTNRF